MSNYVDMQTAADWSKVLPCPGYPTWTRGRHIHGSQDASALLCQDYDQSGRSGDDRSALANCVLICLQNVCNRHFEHYLHHSAAWASLVSLPHLPHPDSPWQPGEHLLEDPFGSVIKRAWSWRPCSSIWSLWGQITWSFALQQLCLNHKVSIISAAASESEHVLETARATLIATAGTRDSETQISSRAPRLKEGNETC